MKISEESLKKLIILCTYNIKGFTEKKEIEKLLPIKTIDLEIYEDSNMLIFKYKSKVIGEVLMENNMYLNLKILTIITPLFGVYCHGYGLLQLMKYRNNIITFLI